MTEPVHENTPPPWSKRSALIVGMGGLGCPVALALARAGVGQLILVDDDVVDVSNLHRQVLFTASDVGKHKLDAARERLLLEGANDVRVERTRMLPDNARALVKIADVVVEGADNFATKFLAADACFLERVPVVHGAAVRFHGTALSVSASGAPCYRCLFEDVLADANAPNCAEAGVFGPMVGIVGCLMADLALDALSQDSSRNGVVHSFDAKLDRVRTFRLRPRPQCSLCGETPSVFDTREARYLAPSCAASLQPHV